MKRVKSEVINAEVLASFKYPVSEALGYYQEMAERLSLDIEAASSLELRPDKGYAARSDSVVTSRGMEVGRLGVLAFINGEGTGDESFRRLAGLTMAHPYPLEPQCVPRSKAEFNREIHMTLFTREARGKNPKFKQFAGTYDLLGINNRSNVKKIGDLGQRRSTIGTKAVLHPAVTLTVGPTPTRKFHGARFGDPHAVFSAVPKTIQVCAFFGVTAELLHEDPEILKGLHPRLPRNLVT